MRNSFAIQRDVKCPFCQQASKFDIWQIVDIEERPDLLGNITSGSLHDVFCPFCEKFMFPVDSPLLVYRPEDDPTFLYSCSEETTDRQDIENFDRLLKRLKTTLGYHWPENWKEKCALGLPSRTILPIFIREGEKAATIAKMDLNSRNEATVVELVRLLYSFITAKTIQELRDLIKSDYSILTSFRAIGVINEIIEDNPTSRNIKTVITRKLTLIRYREIGFDQAIYELDQLIKTSSESNDKQSTFLSHVRNLFNKQETVEPAPKPQLIKMRSTNNLSVENSNLPRSNPMSMNNYGNDEKSQEQIQKEEKLFIFLRKINNDKPESTRLPDEQLKKLMYRIVGDYKAAGDDQDSPETRVLFTQLPNPLEHIAGGLGLNLAIFDNARFYLFKSEESVSEIQGSRYARDLGKKIRADIVVWGYSKTINGENNQIVFIETLTNKQYGQTDESVRLRRQFPNLTSFYFTQRFSNPNNALMDFLEGLCLFQNGIFEYANESFTNAINLQDWRDEPVNQSIVYYYRGVSNLFLNLPDAAIEDLNKAINISPNNLLFIVRGNMYALLKHNQKALDNYSKAISSNPKDPRPHFNRAFFFIDSGSNDEALKDLSQVIKLTPNDYLAYVFRGLVYGKICDFNKALSDFSRSIELAPNNPEAHNHRGTTYSLMGEFAKAIPDLSMAISLNPKDEDSYAKRGEAYKKVGNYDLAIEDCSRAIELNQNHADTFVTRAYSYTKKGEFTKALEDFNKAIQLNPNLAVACGERGLLFFFIGDLDKARGDLRMAAQMDPKYESIYRQWENMQNDS